MHHSYIIRIYRYEKDNPRVFVGTVEKVGEPDKSAFTNYDELWERLNSEGQEALSTPGGSVWTGDSRARDNARSENDPTGREK